VITGVGLTVTVIVSLGPTQLVVAVGVIRYCTVPAAELLGLLRISDMVEPPAAEAPVIPPVIAPIVHV
jgi:hypothetical protein